MMLQEVGFASLAIRRLGLSRERSGRACYQPDRQDYWFGPLHLLGGVGQQLTVDDTTATSLYLTEDAVADAINNLYTSGKITVSSAAAPFPRPTGVPQLLHGDGAPEGLVFAPQGSMYMRRDGTGANSLYTKTTGVTLNTGWQNYTTAEVGPGTTYRKATAKVVNNTTTETDLLNGEITIGAGVLGTSGVARLTAKGDGVQNTGAGQNAPRFKLKLGTTVLIDTGVLVGQTMNAGASRYGWIARAIISNDAATNSQTVSFELSLTHPLWVSPGSAAITTGEGLTGIPSTGGFPYAIGVNSAAIDTTTAQALVLSVINGTASANYEVKLFDALVEII